MSKTSTRLKFTKLTYSVTLKAMPLKDFFYHIIIVAAHNHVAVASIKVVITIYACYWYGYFCRWISFAKFCSNQTLKGKKDCELCHTCFFNKGYSISVKKKKVGFQLLFLSSLTNKFLELCQSFNFQLSADGRPLWQSPQKQRVLMR